MTKTTPPASFGAGDLGKALARWHRTLEWRAEFAVDGILDEPQEHFSAIKAAYPHAFHLRSREGFVVLYQSPGRIDWAALEAAGVSFDQLIRHFIFTQEFLWRRLDPTEDGQCVTVIDVSGVKMGGSGPAMDFLKAMLVILGEHYPERARGKLFCHKCHECQCVTTTDDCNKC